MSSLIDLTGMKFGMLTVLSRDMSQYGKHAVYWFCECECGNICTVSGDHLRGGRTRSCGCASEDFRVSKRRLDIKGQKFGRLTAIAPCKHPETGVSTWLCQCDCGNQTFVVAGYLRNGSIQSCGCGKFNVGQYSANHMTKHGATSRNNNDRSLKRLYGVWCNMKQRCCNPSCSEYHNYGGRGITICDEWINDFCSFRDWAIAHGYDGNAPRGQCTLDRIDVNGNYEPSNCRFVSQSVQSNNRTNSRLFIIDGVSHTASEWSQIYNTDAQLVRGRIDRGWDIERALTEPVHNNGRKRINTV